LPLYRNFKEYSKEEIRNIENKCLELHYKYGNGVCLKNEIHELFHHTYGYSDNSKEQFEEFLQKFKKGELVYRMKEVSLG
jgi:hypothetical protein